VQNISPGSIVKQLKYTQTFNNDDYYKSAAKPDSEKTLKIGGKVTVVHGILLSRSLLTFGL